MAAAGRTAVVTGAAQGIGRGIAQRLWDDNYNVVLADINREHSTASEIDPSGDRVLALELDVREEDGFELALSTARDRWGRVDLLVNNAALTPMTSLWDIAREEWDDVLATNLRGVFFGCRVLGRHMREHGSGRIVNLASIDAHRAGSLTAAHYSASKAGIVALTRVFATELASSNVTVNAISPAATDGPQVRAMAPELIEAYVEANIPLKRVGRPAEIAALVAFLASDAASYITGATVDINGGAFMR